MDPLPIQVRGKPELLLEDVLMKKIKYLFWLLIVVFAALVVFQNKEFFIVERSLKINLFFLEPYESPQLPTSVYYLAVFFVGFLVSYFLSLSAKFKSRRTIRQLNEQVAARDRRIAELDSQAAALKPKEPASAEPDQTRQEQPPAETEA